MSADSKREAPRYDLSTREGGEPSKIVIHGDRHRGMDPEPVEKSFPCTLCGTQVSVQDAIRSVKDERNVRQLEELERMIGRFNGLYGKTRGGGLYIRSERLFFVITLSGL